MGTTLVICLLILATHLHAGSIISSNSSTPTSTSSNEESLLENSLSATPTTPPSDVFDEDAELSKIAESCLSTKNYEQLTGNIVKDSIARQIALFSIKESIVTIGLTELRSTLNLALLPPWQHYNITKPSESELASAPSIEAYYDLKEPRSFMRSLDNSYLYERNLIPAIAYLDERFPSIRTIFCRKFEEIRRFLPKVLDRKAIDRMISEFSDIRKRVSEAVEKMKDRDYECWRAVD